MQSPARSPRKTFVRSAPLRPLYNKLVKAIHARDFLIKSSQGMPVTDSLKRSLEQMRGFLAQEPSEAMCREYISNNLSDVAMIMRGSWATNVKSLKVLINK